MIRAYLRFADKGKNKMLEFVLKLKGKISTHHKAIGKPRMSHVMPNTGNIEDEHFLEA